MFRVRDHPVTVPSLGGKGRLRTLEDLERLRTGWSRSRNKNADSAVEKFYFKSNEILVFGMKLIEDSDFI